MSPARDDGVLDSEFLTREIPTGTPACGGFPKCRCKPFVCAARGCGRRMPEHACCIDCAGELCEACCDKREGRTP